MASNDPYAKAQPSLKRSQTVEEEEGLLSGLAQGSGTKYQETSRGPIEWSRKKIITVASVFIALLITGAFTRTICGGSWSRRDQFTAHSQWYLGEGSTRSNGTNEFKRTVILVSIDGLRADYLDRGLTPYLLDVSKGGLRAKSMRPVFPTLTFPTGLYAESHGIIANNFWDPISDAEFHYNRIDSAWQPQWWFGEPMWETAEKAGVITANLMWPGPPKTTSGASSTYFIPWQDHVALKTKHDQIMNWIDVPDAERPQLITVYEPSLDQAGHKEGPGSALVNKVLRTVDGFAKDLQASLASRNLTDIVDIVFVSDHGMTDT